MPYYNFICPDCEYELRDVKQSLAEHNEPMKCPKCGVVMEQHFDGVNFILSGDGWTTKTGGGVGRKK